MISIQEFTMNHYQAALALWQETPGIGVSSADESDAIAYYLLRNPNNSFVALTDERLVGTILCGQDGRRGYIHHLAVHPDHRHQGIATQLITSALAHLKEIGITKCHLFIFGENDSGIAFWQQNGWVFAKMSISCPNLFQ